MGRIVIAGASIAGMSAARELRRLGFSGSIQLIDEDRHAPYRRPAVSKSLLTGSQTLTDVAAPWAENLKLERAAGVRLLSLDLDHRVLLGARDDEEVAFPFDALVLATGSHARSWPEDPALDGVVTLRSAADAQRVSELLDDSRRIVIIGAGFIGLEVASSAVARGVAVTVVEVGRLPLAQVLGDALGQRLAALHRARGVELLCGVGVTRIEGHQRVERVVLQDGRSVDADVALVAIGAEPSVGWLESSGLDVSNGVVCDSFCRAVRTHDIVAAGDVASWHNPLYGRQMRVEHWTNAIEQATFAAQTLLGAAPPGGFAPAPYFWTDQFDRKLESYGTSIGHSDAAVIEDVDRTLVVAYGNEGILIGVAGLDVSPQTMAKYRKQIEAKSRFDDVAKGGVPQ